MFHQDNKFEFVIEEFWDDCSLRMNYRMKYAGYSMIIPKVDNGYITMCHIQHAMHRLRGAYRNRAFYIPPVQITKIDENNIKLDLIMVKGNVGKSGN